MSGRCRKSRGFQMKKFIPVAVILLFVSSAAFA